MLERGDGPQVAKIALLTRHTCRAGRDDAGWSSNDPSDYVYQARAAISEKIAIGAKTYAPFVHPPMRKDPGRRVFRCRADVAALDFRTVSVSLPLRRRQSKTIGSHRAVTRCLVPARVHDCEAKLSDTCFEPKKLRAYTTTVDRLSTGTEYLDLDLQNPCVWAYFLFRETS